MHCCGHLNDITTQDDEQPIYICGECGKQGPVSAFPDPRPEPEFQPEPEPLSRVQKFRFWLADLIAPKL